MPEGNPGMGDDRLDAATIAGLVEFVPERPDDGDMGSADNEPYGPPQPQDSGNTSLELPGELSSTV